MIKCEYESCQYPDCATRTCGMRDPELIAYLAREVIDLKKELKNTKFMVRSVSRALEYQVKEESYIPTCPFNNKDCIYDPAYAKMYHTKSWVKRGMPTLCGHCEDLLEEGKEILWDDDYSHGCPFYDDEDK